MTFFTFDSKMWRRKKNPSQFILLKISQFSLSPSRLFLKCFANSPCEEWGGSMEGGERVGNQSLMRKIWFAWFFPSKMAALKRTHMTAISNLFHFYLLPNTKTAYVSQDGIMRDEAMKLANSIDSYFTRSFESYAMCRWSHCSVTRIQATTSYVGKLTIFLVFFGGSSAHSFIVKAFLCAFRCLSIVARRRLCEPKT